MARWGQQKPAAVVVARQRSSHGTDRSVGGWHTRGGAMLPPARRRSPVWHSARFYGGLGASRRQRAPRTPTVGTQQTQKIERTHRTLRTHIKRLTRKTSCFARSLLLHDLVIGLVSNRYAFGYAV